VILATFIRQVQQLRDHTELLECLNWDEELTDNFVNELQVMLMVAPPNLEKALFWLQNTPWECFEGGKMPDNVFQTVEILITRTRNQLIVEEAARDRHGSFAAGSWGDEDDWN